MDAYFEYLLEDPNYMGEEMFVMWWVWEAQAYPLHDLDTWKTYNKMHTKYKIQMEWGIGGLK
jgi:hypothetical protein